MASLPNWQMFFLISPIICAVTAWISLVVTDPSTLYTGELDHTQWLLLFLLLLLPVVYLRKKRSSSSSFSSNSFIVPKSKNEVFLSFRGADTRYGFLSHLCLALSQKKIDYFVDDKKLTQGDEISPALLAAIEQSKISLVIFSENYASSMWCLEELCHIIECMKNQSQIVIPIFYKIDPSAVRRQKGSYRDAFSQHEKRFDKLKLQEWRNGLKKVADLAGFHSSNYKTEADFIIEIVQCVLKRLNMTTRQSDLKGLVGIQKHITYLEALLCKKMEGVLIVGIWGMGGIGKTTIAEVLFNRLYDQYEGRYFLNVREGLEKYGRAQLKEKLLSKLLGEVPDIVLHNGILLDCQRRLQNKKVLVVLDDIHRLMQLEILTGGRGWFGSESKIIVTSRDKNMFIKECDYIYEVNHLNNDESLQLFNVNALPELCNDEEEEWCKLSKMVIEFCNGNPLAIKVLGRSLRCCDRNEWKSKLKKLDKILDPEIQDVLKLSYDELDDEEKDIFLYLACFFQFSSKEEIISLLDGDYQTIDGLRVLENKALITIDNGGFVFMHDLVQRMGREIARKKSPKNPGLCNHLWNANDIYKVLKNNMGTEEIESISLEMAELKKDLHLASKAFARMDNLRLLHFQQNYSFDARFRVYAPEEDFVLPAQLRYIRWDFYSSKSIPLRSCLDNLVELIMRHSCLEKLWDGIQDLPNLKVINLAYSSNLIRFPDLSKAPKLELVSFRYCDSLGHVPLWPDHTIDELDSTKCEEYLDQNCLPASLNTDIDGASEEDDHLHLISLPASTLQYVFPSLQVLTLSGCGSIFELPDNICLHLPMLVFLDISWTNLKTLPTSIMHLTKLETLYINDCPLLRYIPELPPSIVCLVANDCTSLETLQFSSYSMRLSNQKFGLYVGLRNCMKLREDTREAVAKHYKLSTTQRIIPAGREESVALLFFPGSKIPECFKNCSARHDSLSIASPIASPS